MMDVSPFGNTENEFRRNSSADSFFLKEISDSRLASTLIYFRRPHVVIEGRVGLIKPKIDFAQLQKWSNHSLFVKKVHMTKRSDNDATIKWLLA